MRWRPAWFSFALGAGFGAVCMVLVPIIVHTLRAMNGRERSGVALAVAALIWFAAGMIALGYHKHTQEWLAEPGNSVRLSLWIGAALLATLTLISPKDSFLGDLRTEAISIALAVIVIDELGRYRARQERKQEIIEQMGSRVKDAALEAVRLATKYEWIYDGSLKGADLWWANLEGARLEEADLQDARLVGAILAGAQLVEANLEGASLLMADLHGITLKDALYDNKTAWPAGFTPPPDAINVDDLPEEERQLRTHLYDEWI